MPKKPSRKTLVRKLDKLAGQKVRERDKNICQKCGKYVTGSNCHVSHVIPRSKGYALRWDMKNLKVLCFHDHINWWHKNPLESGEWFKEKFPGRAEYLEQHKNDIVRSQDRPELLESKLIELG